MEIRELSRKDLCDFLITAKKNTYAQDGPRMPSKCIHSKNYLYENCDFRYEDQYFGEFLDVGNETVWYKDVPVWGMVYRGGIHEEHRQIHKQVFAFLRQALMHPEQEIPVRGPTTFINNQFTYFNLVKGDILSFQGRELVTSDGIEICFRDYLGGLIFGKLNRDMQIVG